MRLGPRADDSNSGERMGEEMSKIPTSIDMHVLYAVESCTMNLGRGNAHWYVVKQVNGIADEVPIAVFINQEHARHYANFLMETKKQVTQ